MKFFTGMHDPPPTQKEMHMSITYNQILPAVALAGLTPVEQSSFYKVALNGKALYISKTKRSVTRIDVSGFNVFHPAVKPIVKKNGKVTGQINMAHPDAMDAIHEALRVLVNGEIQGTKVA